MKFESINVRGYDLEQFKEPFARYLPPPENDQVNSYSATAEGDSTGGSSGVALKRPTTDIENMTEEEFLERVLDITGGELLPMRS